MFYTKKKEFKKKFQIVEQRVESTCEEKKREVNQNNNNNTNKNNTNLVLKLVICRLFFNGDGGFIKLRNNFIAL